MRAKQGISLIILLFINFLFLYKYASRYTDQALIISILVTVFYLAVFVINSYLNIKIQKKYIIGAVAAFCILLPITFYIIPVEKLNIDRWSVISSFWDAWLSGKYPYFAQSHMGNPPGPMPFYFVLALPFFLIGELGFITLAGVIIFAWVFMKRKSENNLFTLLFLLTSPIIIYETITRSTVFFNGTLFLLYFLLLLTADLNKLKKCLIYGLIGGFLLSTRNVFGLSFILFAGYAFFQNKHSFKSILIYAFFVTIGFVVTFVPLLIQFPLEFWQMNPFIVQSSFLIPPKFILLFLFITVVLQFLIKTPFDLIFYNGLLFFLIIAVYFFYHILNSGFDNAYRESVADITYFILAAPFFLYLISGCKINEVKESLCKT